MRLRKLFAFAASLLLLSCRGTDERPNILLIIVDTVNAEHMSCYGYERLTTPGIDSLAATGVRYAHCQAQAPWTLPGMTTIFTGLSEKSHGCNLYNDYYHGLDPEMPTLTTLLRESGYRTASFVNILYLGPEYGLNRDFDHFWMGADSNYAEITIDTVLAFMDNGFIRENDPFFLTVHLFDPHLPYEPPPPFDSQFRSSGTLGVTEWPDEALCSDSIVIYHMTAMYDSELLWTDSQLSRLFAGLRASGAAENTLVILVADHGEEFMEHGAWGHASNLYQQSLHVPLIITGPGIPGDSVFTGNVGQIDVLPTILDYIDVPVPDHVEGTSLLGSVLPDRVLPSSGNICDTLLVSCLQEGSKVIWHPESDSTETYDLTTDPGEMSPLATDSLLLDEVMSYWAWPCICTPMSFSVDSIMELKLRDLGYVN